MSKTTVLEEEGPTGGCVLRVHGSTGEVFVTDEHATKELAQQEVNAWLAWSDGVPSGTVESIYYIVCVPETWVGGIALGHPYSGLQVKIGRTKNVLKRLSNLQTGSPGRLFVHALEPGGSELESVRHAQFDADRRNGEWFACSARLANHMTETWMKYRILPPGHWQYIYQLRFRSDINAHVREVFGGAPDMVNPSLEDPWQGKVFVDLVNFGRIERKPSK